MSKTAEAEKFYRSWVGDTPDNLDQHSATLDIMVDFANQQSSSKDASIKELEAQISGTTFFDEKEAMESKIIMLEARLETAEKVVVSLSDWSKKYPRGRVYNASKMTMDDELVEIEESSKKYTDAFLTNKTE